MLSLTLSVALLSASPQEPATDAERLMRLVPEESFMALCAHDIEGLRSSAHQSNWAKFARDKRVQPFFDHVLQNFSQQVGNDLMGEMNELQLGLIFEAFSGSFAGFAGSTDDQHMDKDSFCGLVFLLGETQSEFAELTEEAFLFLEENSAITRSSVAHGGAEITIFERPDAAILFSQRGNLVSVVVSEKRSIGLPIIEGIIERSVSSGSGLGLGGNKNLIDARKSVGFTGHGEFFFDLDRVWKDLEANDKLDAGPEVPAELLSSMTQIHWAHAAARLGKGEAFDVWTGISWPTEGSLGRFGKLFQTLPLDLLSRIPSDCISANSIGFNVSGLFDLVCEIVGEQDPNSIKQLEEGMAMLKEGMGIDVKRDFLNQFNGGFATFSMRVPETETAAGNPLLSGMPAPGNAFMIGLKDHRRMESTLDKVLALTQAKQDITWKHHEGHKIASLQIPDQPVTLSWSFFEGALVISTERTPLLHVIDIEAKQQSSAIEHDLYGPAIQVHRAQPSVSFSSTPESMKLGIEMAQGMLAMFPALAAMSGDQLPPLPFSADTPWPAPEAVDEHFRGIMTGSILRSGKSLAYQFSAR